MRTSRREINQEGRAADLLVSRPVDARTFYQDLFADFAVEAGDRVWSPSLIAWLIEPVYRLQLSRLGDRPTAG